MKIGGVRAGTVNTFELTDTEPYRVAVEVEVTEPGSTRSAPTRVPRPEPVADRRVLRRLRIGTAKQELPEGGRCRSRRTSSSIPPDLIASVMRRPYRERFRLILSELGVGLAGRPEDLNEVIRRAHPALKEVTETSDPRPPERDHPRLHHRRGPGQRRGRAEEGAALALGPGGDGDRRDPGVARRPAPGPVEQAADLPGELRPTLAQLDATAASRSRSGACTPRRPTSTACSSPWRVRQCVARIYARYWGDGVVGRKALDRVRRGDRRAPRAVRGRAAAGQAAQAVPPDHRRPRAVGRAPTRCTSSSRHPRPTRRPRRTARASPAWRRS